MRRIPRSVIIVSDTLEAYTQRMTECVVRLAQSANVRPHFILTKAQIEEVLKRCPKNRGQLARTINYLNALDYSCDILAALVSNAFVFVLDNPNEPEQPEF